MTQEELDKDMIESIEMWLHEIEPKWVEKELAWLDELRSRLLEEKSEKPVCEKLEEADLDTMFEEYFDKYPDGLSLGECSEYFYKKGKKDMKEQMLKEAVEYDVGMHGEPIQITLDKYVQRAKGIFPGDKVRLVIIKED